MAGFNKPGRRAREDGKNARGVASNKYQKENYDRIPLLVLKGNKEKIKARAAERGETVSGYINKLLAADIPGFTTPNKNEYLNTGNGPQE